MMHLWFLVSAAISAVAAVVTLKAYAKVGNRLNLYTGLLLAATAIVAAIAAFPAQP